MASRCLVGLTKIARVSSGRLGGQFVTRNHPRSAVAILQCSRQHSAGRRPSSSYSAWASMVDVEKQGEFTVVKMTRPPVNSFSLEFLEELNIVLEDLENDRSCRGLILTSGVPNIFSAGLDLKLELLHPKEARLKVFWRRFQEFWMRLYGSRLVIISAINGHAIAGGCVAALASDYRIMGSGYKIGLTETKVGLHLPPMVADTVLNTVGYRRAELVSQLGMVFTAEEALEMRMIDKIVAPELVVEQAVKEMEKWLQIPDTARSAIKLEMRRKFVKRLEDRRDEDIQDFVSLVMSDSTQKTLESYVEGLKKNKSNKK